MNFTPKFLSLQYCIFQLTLQISSQFTNFKKDILHTTQNIKLLQLQKHQFCHYNFNVTFFINFPFWCAILKIIQSTIDQELDQFFLFPQDSDKILELCTPQNHKIFTVFIALNISQQIENHITLVHYYYSKGSNCPILCLCAQISFLLNVLKRPINIRIIILPLTLIMGRFN